jgi:hypothetical protein
MSNEERRVQHVEVGILIGTWILLLKDLGTLYLVLSTTFHIFLPQKNFYVTYKIKV